MLSRRIPRVGLSVVLVLAAAVAPVAAADPPRQAPPPKRPAGERPLTPTEQAVSDAKVSAAMAYAARMKAAGAGLVTLACVTPNQQPGMDASTAEVNACYIPAGYLTVEARQQEENHYCGPAAGQVIANYAWAMKAGMNKYSQDKIAGWMKTNLNGLTNAPELAAGLQSATLGSPRHPANFGWGVTELRDLDGDGTTGDELQDYVRAAVSSWRMPVAIAVKPHDKNSDYHLSSWPRVVASSGHWITGYGWYSYWVGTDFSRIYYTDSSKNQGGGTGKYWDPTLDLAKMIGEHTRRFVW
jgi:hypothetical protein